MGLLLLMIPLLAACAPGAPATPSQQAPTYLAPSLPAPSTTTPAAATATSLPATPTLSPIPPITASDWQRGPEGARHTLLLYCDFQSPPCAALADTIRDLQQLRPGDVQLVYRHFPLMPLNDKAVLAAVAAEAAGLQGAFWEMHDLLYTEQGAWASLTPEAFPAWAVEAVGRLGLDREAFEAVLSDPVLARELKAAFEAGVAAGIPGTPFLFVDGQWMRARPTLANLEAALRLEDLQSKQYAGWPGWEVPSEDQLIAHLLFDTGEVTIELFPESAPLTVASFVGLARDGWFDGSIPHRVVPGRYVELGDPTGTGYGWPGYFLPEEIDPALHFDQPGVVAVASVGPGTGGSQFAITLAQQPTWEGTRTIFGEVVEGLELLSSLEPRQPLEDLLKPPAARLERVWIEAP